MTKWEYWTIGAELKKGDWAATIGGVERRGLEPICNASGERGWELVSTSVTWFSISPFGATLPSQITLFFKRPVAA